MGGGTDLTLPVIEEIFKRYKVEPAMKNDIMELVKKYIKNPKGEGK